MTVDQAKELSQLNCWKELCKELDVRIKSETYKLLHCKPEELIAIQSRVLALQALVRLPQDVIDREEGPESLNSVRTVTHTENKG